MYDINFDRLIRWMHPVFLRKPILLALLRAVCYPFSIIHANFLAYRDNVLYILDHDSTVYSIENVLNDRFDSADRMIYITDGFTKERIYLYTRVEDKPEYLNPDITLYNRGDYADTGIDFIVWVPTAVTVSAQDLIELRALVNRYKLAGKRFEIYRVTI